MPNSVRTQMPYQQYICPAWLADFSPGQMVEFSICFTYVHKRIGDYKIVLLIRIVILRYSWVEIFTYNTYCKVIYNVITTFSRMAPPRLKILDHAFHVCTAWGRSVRTRCSQLQRYTHRFPEILFCSDNCEDNIFSLPFPAVWDIRLEKIAVRGIYSQ